MIITLTTEQVYKNQEKVINKFKNSEYSFIEFGEKKPCRIAYQANPTTAVFGEKGGIQYRINLKNLCFNGQGVEENGKLFSFFSRIEMINMCK